MGFFHELNEWNARGFSTPCKNVLLYEKTQNVSTYVYYIIRVLTLGSFILSKVIFQEISFFARQIIIVFVNRQV